MLSGLAACSTVPPAPQVVTPPPPTFQPQALATVLVAGDSEQPVFDNAINYLHAELASIGVAEENIHQLSVRYARTNEPATLDRILARIAQTHAPANGGCLVYMTSHGVFGQGLYLELSDSVLTPAALDAALRKGCGNAPTVTIVSSCFSGQFAAPPLVQANRIIMTASAADRSSFGCGSDYIYTYFDDCLMGSLDGAPTWQEIFRRTAGCVAKREMQSGAQPSQPRAAFGARVADLPSPWQGTSPAAGPELVFQPSGRSFDPAHVPLSPGDRKSMQDELDYYDKAPSPKALAIAPIGFPVAVAADGTGKRTADDVARIALQRCEWLTGGGCVLYARDDRTTASLAYDLPPFHPQLLVREGPLRADIVPFIRDDQRTQILDYAAMKGPKALALSPSHDEISIGIGPTQAAASQDALARCQFVMENCILYAEDDHIILGW
jgi:Peptidase C13 family